LRKNDKAGAEKAFAELSTAQQSGAPVTESLLCGLKNYAVFLHRTGRGEAASQMDARVEQLEANAGFGAGKDHDLQVGYLSLPE
jgi:hypothetical protein